MDKFDKLRLALILQDIEALYSGNPIQSITSTAGTLMANVDEDGFVVVKKDSKQWRKAVVRAISPWSADHFQLQYGDTVLLPDDKGLKLGKTQCEAPDGSVHVIEHGAFVNGLKILGVIKKV